MTPSELKKIAAAVAELLSRESNTDLSAEELSIEVAEAAIEVYEDIQSSNYNLIVLGHFRLDDDTSYVAAVGPLSTRAKARARDIGEHFAWDYKTRRGTGQYVLVPLIRNPRDAWDKAREKPAAQLKAGTSVTPGIDPSYIPMRFELTEEQLESISADWQVDPEMLRRKFGPACRCGRRQEAWTAEGGGSDDGTCPRHPEGQEGDS